MNEPAKPTYEELEQTISVLRQQRNALSSMNLDWEGRCALLNDKLANAHKRIDELTPQKDAAN